MVVKDPHRRRLAHLAIQDRLDIERLFPQYERPEVLSRSNNTCVLKVWHRESQRRVVIKCIERPELESPDTLQQFADEAATLSALDHPGIPQFIASGIRDHRPFVAYDYIAGSTLDAHVESNDLTLRQRLELMARVCDTVTYAHDERIVHADIKPTNIIANDDEEAWLVDFGLARNLDRLELRDRSSFAHRPRGTFMYMSPEAMEGNGIDCRSDVYSLGMTLYEVVTGSTPFDHGEYTHGQAIDLVRYERPKNATTKGLCAKYMVDRSMAASVIAIIDKATEKSPETRYQSVADLRHDLQLVLDGRSPKARTSAFRRRAKRACARCWKPVSACATLIVVVLVTAAICLEMRPTADELYRRQVDDMIASYGQETAEAFLAKFPVPVRDPNAEVVVGSEFPELCVLHPSSTEWAVTDDDWFEEYGDAVGRFVTAFDDKIIGFRVGDLSRNIVDLDRESMAHATGMFEATMRSARVLRSRGRNQEAADHIRAAMNIHTDIGNASPSRTGFERPHVIHIYTILSRFLNDPNCTSKEIAIWRTVARELPETKFRRESFYVKAAQIKALASRGMSVDSGGDEVIDHDRINLQTGGQYDRLDPDWREYAQMQVEVATATRITDGLVLKMQDWDGLRADTALALADAHWIELQAARRVYPLLYSVGSEINHILSAHCSRIIREAIIIGATIAEPADDVQVLPGADTYLGGDLIVETTGGRVTVVSSVMTDEVDRRAVSTAEILGAREIDGRLQYYPLFE